MPFLPDTNVWISLLKNPGGKLVAKVEWQPVSEIFLCSVVKAELWHGAEKYGNRERRKRALDMLLTCSSSRLYRSRLTMLRRGTMPKSGNTWKFKAGFWGPRS